MVSRPRMKKTPLLAVLLAFMNACTPHAEQAPRLIDSLATPQTVALHQNLHLVGREHVLFGHHDTLAYGHDWIGDADRSDVKDVAGDFPAMYGWDLAPLEPKGANEGVKGPGITPDMLLAYVRQAHARGGVVNFSWHQRNPVTGGSFYDLTPALHTLLPGGANHEYYKGMLDRFAAFFSEISPMPVIFRPYHEHNGSWFWWGRNHASEADYIALWRFTVEYLRDVKGVHNLVYAFSPDRGGMNLEKGDADYFYGWPGDEYVDIIGLDDYKDVRLPAEGEGTMADKQRDLVAALTMIARIAQERGKLPALTETGCERIDIPRWWTDILLAGLKANEHTRRIAYVEVWRNANAALEKAEHYFAPFPGHPSAGNFVEFCEDPFVLLESELPDMYSPPIAGETGAKAQN
jgi:mannan endo-1,4-beta-mannosidase